MDRPKLDPTTRVLRALILGMAALALLVTALLVTAAKVSAAPTAGAAIGGDMESMIPAAARTRRSGDSVTFRYLDDGFTAVAVAGSFNDWQPVAMTLDSEERVWSVAVDLDPGRHRYQFLVEDAVEAWEAIDPSNPHARRGDERGWVSLITVPEVGDDPTRKDVTTESPDVQTDGTTFNFDIRLGYDDDEDEDEDHWRDHRRRFVDRELDRLDTPQGENVSFQRVDGLSMHINPSGISREDYGPAAKGLFSYGFRSREWTLGGVLVQPLLANRRLLARIEGHSGTDFRDNTGIGGVENSLAGVFFREDFRDYYEREGVSVSLVGYPMSTVRLEAGYESSDESSLATKETWSFADGEFADNPAVDEGTLRSYFAKAMIGTRNNHVLATWESGRNRPGDRFDYSLLKTTYRGRLHMSPSRHLDFRAMYATGLAGELPAQRRFPVGGLGTVRGYWYQSLLTPDPDRITPAVARGGQRMLVANLEYAFSFDNAIEWTLDTDDDGWGEFESLSEMDIDSAVFVFFDAGMAWENRSAAFDLEDLKSSAGIGFQLDDWLPRVDVIKTLDEGGHDTMVQVRLERTF